MSSTVDEDRFVLGSSLVNTAGKYITPMGSVLCHHRTSVEVQGPLLPVAPGQMWKYAPLSIRRKTVWLPKDIDSPDRHYEQMVQSDERDAENVVQCISSVTEVPRPPDGLSPYVTPLHMPMFDVDVERLEDTHPLDALLSYIFRADRYWIPSTTHWHVYIDTPGTVVAKRGITWADYQIILEFLAGRATRNPYGVDPGWAWYAKKEGKATLRDPLRRKRVTLENAKWVCMWCAQPFQLEEELEEHEAECM